MTTVDDMIKRMEATIPLIYDIVGYAIQESSADAIFFNQQQLLDHLKSDGKYLKAYKSQTYADIKLRMNQRPPTNLADAHYTGELFAMMHVVVPSGGDRVLFGSDSDHALFMEARDGPEIFGLTVQSVQQYKEIYMPIAQRIVRERTVGIY